MAICSELQDQIAPDEQRTKRSDREKELGIIFLVEGKCDCCNHWNGEFCG
jgi:hypothetical protein